MKSEMTSAERLTAYRAGECVDRIPYTTGLNESAVSFYGYNNIDYLFSSDVMVDVEHRIIDEFGGDNIGFSINTRAFAEAAGSRLEYRERGYSVIREHIVHGKEDIKRLSPIDAKTAGRFPIILEALKKAQDLYGNETPVWFSIPCPANCALGVTDLKHLLYYMKKDPDSFRRILDYCLDGILNVVKVYYSETGITPGIFDVTASRQVMGRKHFENNIYPYIKKTVEGIKAITGRVPSFSSCGSNEHIWDLLLDLRIPSLGVDSTDSIVRAKEVVGEHIPISGNFESLYLLDRSGDEIEQAVRTLIKNASDSKNGYTLGIGGGPAAYGTTRPTMERFRDAVLKYGRGAQKGKVCLGVSR